MSEEDWARLKGVGQENQSESRLAHELSRPEDASHGRPHEQEVRSQEGGRDEPLPLGLNRLKLPPYEDEVDVEGEDEGDEEEQGLRPRLPWLHIVRRGRRHHAQGPTATHVCVCVCSFFPSFLSLLLVCSQDLAHSRRARVRWRAWARIEGA